MTVLDVRFVRGDDFEMVVDSSGDHSAAAFAAALQPNRSVTVPFDVAVGTYNAGTDSTPVTVTLPNATSSLLDPGTYPWDLELTEAGTVSTVIGGEAIIIPDVTPAPVAVGGSGFSSGFSGGFS